jgi:hypothetical protein
MNPAVHICRYCGGNHLEGTPLPLEQWNWRQIVQDEQTHLARMAKGPRCEVCHRPMVCGQERRHKVCQVT